jgi:hypothetical protein
VFSISDLAIVYVYLALLKLILKFRIGKFAGELKNKWLENSYVKV